MNYARTSDASSACVPPHQLPILQTADDLREIPKRYEVFKSPLEDFRRAVAEAGLADRVRYLSHGETYNFALPARRVGAA